VETDPSAVTGGQTAGQGAEAFCPFVFSAQPEARHKAINSHRSWHLQFWAGRRVSQQSGFAFLLEAVAFALDVEGGGVMQQAIENSSGQDGVIEDLAPIEKAFVAGDDQAGAFVTASDQAEEQAGFGVGEGQITDLIDDECFGVAELLQGSFQAILVEGFRQAGQQLLQCQEQDGVPGLHRFHAQAR
jgi:hypothetical protein